MQLARTIVAQVLLLRNESKIKVRQPLSRILVVTGNDVQKETVELVAAPILEELNVQTIEYVANSSDIVKRSAKPNFSAAWTASGQTHGRYGCSDRRIGPWRG